MSVMKSDTFDVDLFETRLESLKDTQEGIQQMSSWCLQQRGHHKKIVASWLNVLKRVRVEHRLCLFYLANDVIQYSKRKRYEFVESWATALQRATTMVRDDRVKSKILRIFNIWEQREVYSDEFISDLHGLLNINPPKKVQAPVEQSTDDYQNTILITNVRECVELSNSTDLSFKKLPRAPNCDMENIKQQLKDKSHSEDVEKEIERYMAYIEAYNRNLQSEIRSRKAVLTSLDAAIQFYSNQRGEVKVVVGAYKNFGSRIKLVKKKLDEIIPNLPSPIPSPDINAPSPEPDTDLQLPDERESTISMNMFKGTFNGFSSYLDGNLPFDINDFKRDDNKINTSSSSTASQPIEVIATRPDDTANDSFNSSVEYYKPESISAYPGGSSVEIPGLSPMPVPPVQSEYTSLARAANQYGIIQAPHQPVFGSNSLSRGYSPLISSYNDNSYHNNVGSGISTGGGGGTGMPLMPPPMPPSLIGGSTGNGSVSRNAGDDFNSTWDMNMSWTQLDSTTVSSSTSFDASETMISPVFDRKVPSVEDGTVNYAELGNSLGTTQDVDHRQLHLTNVAASIGIKLGLSKEKSRQLDIDHRNLISLTGSPITNEDTTSKKSWLSSEDKDFRTNDLFATGDVDYRSGIGLGQAIQTIDSITAPQASNVACMQPPPLPPGFLGFGSMRSPNKVLSKPSETESPEHNSNNTAASAENHADNSGISSGYDPSDMVVDMDMSDEDLEDIFREVTEDQGSQEPLELSQTSSGTDVSIAQPQQHLLPENAENEEEQQEAEVSANSTRPPLLETPPEYVPQNNIWDHPSGHNASLNPFHPPGIGMDEIQEQQQQQQQHDNWNQPMPGYMTGGGGGGGGAMFPPPPQAPFQMHPQHMQEQQPHFPPQQYGPGPHYMGGAEHGGGHMGRGRGRGWGHSSPNPFRNAQRPPRGGGSPYFNNRGGRGGGPGMRGSFRGKFRGNNSWI